MAAGAAPVVPEAGLGVAAIATALGWLVLACVLWIYRRSLGRLLIYFADRLDAIKFLRVRPLGPLAAALRYVHKQTDHFLAEGMLACEKATVYLLHAMWSLLVWTAREIADLAVTTEHALGLQRAADIPKLIAQITAPLKVAVRQAVRATHAAELHADQLFGRARAGIDKLGRTLTKTITKQVARVGTRVGRLERTIASPRWWRKHWASLITPAIAAAIFTTALGRLGLRWLRCSNVKKTGRAVCGMDASLLEDLLLGVATLTIGLNLRTFAEEMGEVVEDTAKYIGNRVT